jgi:tripartite-type tricarboxylate transporter receptor subunit TctC
MNLTRSLKISSIFFTIILGLGAAIAQDFPSRPVKVVVTFPPGGGADLTARIISTRLAEVWKQPVLVENRLGGGGNVGADHVLKSQADGYTILLLTASHIGNAAMLEKLTFDLLKDFTPVALSTTSPIMLAVNPSVKAKDLKEFVELLRANPDKMDYASCGMATTHHFSMELFKYLTKTAAVHIPHRCAQAVVEAVGGQLRAIAVTMPPALPFVRNGQLRAIGVTSLKRSTNAPEVPTFAESGVPELKNFAVENYYGFAVSAATPKNLVSKLEADIRKVLAEPELQKKLFAAGFDIFSKSSVDSAELLRADLDVFQRVAKTAGIKQE